ncbi:CDC27 family protein [Parabacteroides sp. AM08-6]|uniref:tetratricopeptide repeat protein n=1 Tax=Parabacteroides sp. AM08-6 TaxID=2292053 RepID=UPI000EFEBA48|nr:CDC27 family protein [Parabacteroides sp. AM08-6]RHJ87645.1 multidrug transporter [Parabacteroides sp. AM08-6]
MKKEEILRLLQRYLSSHKEGKDAYFDADEIDELLDSFEESEDYTYYEEVLALGLRLHPGNTDLQIRKCKFFIYEEEYESALALIETIAETENMDLDILRLECYCMLDAYDQAIEYTEKLIHDGCNYLESIFEYISPILNDAEMYKEAQDYITRGLKLFPKNLVLKDELCFVLEVEGYTKQAIEICNELIDKNPYSYDYWSTLGRLYSMNAEYEKAIEAFDFALTCDDSEDEIKILKAFCLYMNENYEKAIEVYNEIPINEENSQRIIPLLAECYIKLEDYPKAYTLLTDIVTKKGKLEDVNTYITYIRSCAEMGYNEEASKMLLKAYELYPNNIRILSLLALAYIEQGCDKEAMEITDRLFFALDESDEKKTEDFESLFHAGRYLYMKGEIDKAIEYYTKVFEVHPDMPYIHLHLAMAYLAKGDMQHFEEHYSQTSPKELIDYLEKSGINFKDLVEETRKHIAPEDLTKEFLKNKDNKN